MKYKILLSVFCVFLAACSTTKAPQYNLQEFTTANYQKNVDNAVDAADLLKDFDQSKLPRANLSANDLSSLVQADLFFNQGQYQNAYILYKNLAFKYQDPRIIYKAIICLEHLNVNQTQTEELNQLVALFIKTDPNSKLARLFQIKFALATNNIKLAKQSVDALITKDPKNARPVFLFISSIVSSDITASSGNTVAAFSDYVVKEYRDYPEAHLLATIGYAVSGANNKLKDELEYIHLNIPTWKVPLYWSLDILAHNDQYNEIIALVTPLLQEPSENITLQNIYVAALIGNGDLATAKTYLEARLNNAKNKDNVLINLALVDASLGNYESAVTNFKLANPKNQVLEQIVALTTGMILDYIGNTREATTYYKTIINPNLIPIRDNILLNDYILTNNDQEATRLFAKLIAESKMNQKDGLLFEASYYMSLGKYQEAYNVLAKNRRHYANDPAYLYQYASSAAMIGKTKEAINSYKRYIKLDPSNPYGYNDLGYTYATQTKNLKLALQYAQKAYSMAASDPTVLDTLGWVYYKNGEYSKALPYVKTGYDMTHDPDSARHLVAVYQALNQQQLATAVTIVPEKELYKQLQLKLVEKMLKVIKYVQLGIKE